MWALVLTSLGFWRNGTDPVNIPKLLILGAFSGLVLGNVVVAKLYQENKIVIMIMTQVRSVCNENVLNLI
jgi:hypothetical protein